MVPFGFFPMIASVVESTGDHHDGYAGLEHLGRHEVAKIVQTELAKAGGSSVSQEGLGDPVRFPGSGATVVAEDEPVGAAWWTALLQQDEPRIHVVARLPFWSPRPEGTPHDQALVDSRAQSVGATDPYVASFLENRLETRYSVHDLDEDELRK